MPLNQLTLSWVLGQVSLRMRLLRAISELAVALWVLWTQALLVFKARCFGGIPQVQVLKVGVPDVGFKPSLLLEKLQVFSSFPVVGHCTKDGIYHEIMYQPLCLSYLLQCGF